MPFPPRSPIPNPAHPFLPDAHFREWGRFDEQSWVRTLYLPAGKPDKDTANNPVFTTSPTGGNWDEKDVVAPSILYIPDFDAANPYYMYYMGREVSPTEWRIGMARSPDGINFTRCTGFGGWRLGCVLDHGVSPAWDSKHVNYASVIYDRYEPTANKFKMWYTGYYTGTAVYQIGYAYSSDGESWTKSAANPILSPVPATWEDRWVLNPAVLRMGNFYYMWYSGWSGTVPAVGLCVGTDEETFTRYPNNPVMQRGAAGEWDDTSLGYLSVYFDQGVMYIFYAGNDGVTGFQGGVAMSNFGWSIDKHFMNPLVPKGATGEWDDEQSGNGMSVLRFEKEFVGWYGGYDGSKFQIGRYVIPIA